MIHDLLSLFKEEVEELNIAKKVCEDAKVKGNVSVEHFSRLISSYERNLRAMMKITKISDFQHIYLHEIKESMQKEIEERRRIEEKLKYYAYTDPMTGVSNRRISIMKLKEEVKNCLKENSYFSLCYIDIDGLKKVNDEYGHAEGNYLINTTVDIIKESIREFDTVSRMGGDEFMVIFPRCSYQEADVIIKKVLKRIEEINETKVKSYEISFSYGIKEINENTKVTDVEEIIKVVDKLMYENKVSKKDRFKTN